MYDLMTSAATQPKTRERTDSGRPAQLAMPAEPLTPANQNDADAPPQTATSCRWRSYAVDGLLVRSDLPDSLPVLLGEENLLRIYFADLIEDVLKAPS